ncbi:cytochrome c oxidase cbb3-type subunit 2 [Neorhodopirellula lusitana]|uniref:Cytochrome c oxidase cbb3-type subunit 2 n=1 Tax=Neorhodopirellula lusitana TaxID=445327 RepID=A0ABY1Q797_9BACT|nr:cbb3-type cytochrome c oxidase subunit II [Neorhodopirellula lusitana]SMP60970.1 cytochrome c oxidase cbb3-type subunit 2 [Neorhodopirellula lusitana]
MNRIPLIMAGVLATVIASLFGLVLIPDMQFDQMQPKEIMAADGSTAMYPLPLDDFREAPGKEVYRSMGCVYCHSQQVRPEGFGADIDRGWGQRRSVPRDYVLQQPPYLGTMRTGPDLANIGVRQPSDEWHLLHLYDPQITSPGSVMPPFKFLFETTVGKEPNPPLGSPAIRLPESYASDPTWIVPDERAISLVAYLKTLSQKYDVEDVQ